MEDEEQQFDFLGYFRYCRFCYSIIKIYQKNFKNFIFIFINVVEVNKRL